MDKQNVRTLSLIVCCFTYLLVGAAVFDALESEAAMETSRLLLERERHLQEKYNITVDDLEDIRLNVIKMVPYKAGTQWKFTGSFYFALTVIAVIGYGHSTPKTVDGKIFCMFYAISGIPLCMVMFQSVGERLNIFITFLLRDIKKGLKLKSLEVSQSTLLLITLSMSSVVLAAGAAIFSHYEGWQYVDAFYYCFITLTTIGFGDFVALQNGDMLSRNPNYVAFTIIFIVFGLTVLSAAMNLLVLRFLAINVVEEQCGDTEAVVAGGAVTIVHLDDDDEEVITTKGLVVSAAQETPEASERLSVCSCSCYNLRSRMFRKGPRFADDLPMFRKPSPGIFSGSQSEIRKDKHQHRCQTEDGVSLLGDKLFVPWGGHVHAKRASI